MQSLSLRVFFSRHRLDQQLAEGADPTSSSQLELRARQLVQEREQLAARIDRVLAIAHRPRQAFTAQVPLRRAAVLEAEDDLRALTVRLRDGVPIDPQGAALTARLLSEGASPLYAENAYSLRYTARAARLALDPLGDVAEQFQRAAA
jgi:hypothetical protein